MKRALAFIVMAVLLFGCIREQSGAENGQARNSSAEAIQEAHANASGTQGQVSGTKNQTNLTQNSSVIPLPQLDTTGVMMADFVPPPKPSFDFMNATGQDGRLVISFFYLPRCSACLTIRPEIDKLKSKYPKAIWNEYDISNQTGRWAYDAFVAQRNVSLDRQYVPQVLINGVIITTWMDINATLESNMTEYYQGIGNGGAG